MRGQRLSRSEHMPSSCPGCGTEIEFAEQEGHLRTGRCTACGHDFVLLEGAALPSPLPAGSEAGSSSATTEGEVSLPECVECGSSLILRTRRDGSIEARCDECESTTIYVPQGEENEDPEERPRRLAPRGPGGPRGRPCRQCGAPLRFSTNEEGLLVGECEACGNRFVLPPREGRGAEGRRFDRGGNPRGRPYGGRRGGSRWGGPSRGGNRRSRGFRTGSYESEEGDRRPRRRRRSEE